MGGTNAGSNDNANANGDTSSYAPYSLTGGAWGSPRKKRTTKTKAKPRAKARASPKKAKAKAKPVRKMYVGRSGGTYYLKRGKKIYVSC